MVCVSVISVGHIRNWYDVKCNNKILINDQQSVYLEIGLLSVFLVPHCYIGLEYTYYHRSVDYDNKRV